ncbi:MAG: hypothetical protein J0M12_04245 [Deltaproteobacteria bacterium]|nr:hypothetical protein [Deltaproteobacteria bacterium]
MRFYDAFVMLNLRFPTRYRSRLLSDCRGAVKMEYVLIIVCILLIGIPSMGAMGKKSGGSFCRAGMGLVADSVVELNPSDGVLACLDQVWQCVRMEDLTGTGLLPLMVSCEPGGGMGNPPP